MSSVLWEQNTIAKALWTTGKVDFPIYDMHGHMGMHPAIYFHRGEPEEMVKHLKRAGIKHLVFSHHLALDGTMRNAEVCEICKRYPDILRMYVSINPNFQDNIKEDLALFDKWAPYAIGLKILADYHGVPCNNEKYKYALDFAEERSLPVLFHTWGRSPYNGGAIMMDVVQKYHKAKLFMGHCIFGEWDYAERVVKESAGNVWLELTAVPGERGLIKRLCEAVGSDRILFGTDMPWFDEFQAIGGVVSSGITEGEMKNILWHNPESILGKDW